MNIRPFDEELGVDEEAYRRHLRDVARGQSPGFFDSQLIGSADRIAGAGLLERFSPSWLALAEGRSRYF
jgi:hypothetical protein